MDTETKIRLDVKLQKINLAKTRSQANNLIKLSKVKVDGKIVTKSSYLVDNEAKITLNIRPYVGRAAYKLESVLEAFKIDFKNKNILDIGSSTGGFSELSLMRGAGHVIAIEKGSNQMDQILKQDSRIELHERTDILNVNRLNFIPDIILMDLSFISIREVLEHILKLITKDAILIIMLKPQFETRSSGYKHKGVIKNQKIRREIIKAFELWIKNYCLILNKADSTVLGAKGNQERFYLLRKIE